MAMPESSRQSVSFWMVWSRMSTSLAPASIQLLATAATTAGLVLAASSGVLAKDMFGLITTRCPCLTKRFMPPSSSMARATAFSGLPVTTARSGAGELSMAPMLCWPR